MEVVGVAEHVMWVEECRGSYVLWRQCTYVSLRASVWTVLSAILLSGHHTNELHLK